MQFSFAIFSADWPIVSPVDGSEMAGATGMRSRGRVRAKVAILEPKLLALLASTRTLERRRDARIGISESDSAPPAIITSACPIAIWSWADAIAWVAEAQARFNE